MSGVLRVLFTASRDLEPDTSMMLTWDLYDLVSRSALSYFPFTFVHGDCPTGGDRQVRNTCQGNSWVREERYPANFDGPFRKAAGPIRNKYMVSLGASVCLAYPLGESKGTRGCAKMAQEAGIPTLVTEAWTVYVPLEERLRAAGILGVL